MLAKGWVHVIVAYCQPHNLTLEWCWGMVGSQAVFWRWANIKKWTLDSRWNNVGALLGLGLFVTLGQRQKLTLCQHLLLTLALRRINVGATSVTWRWPNVGLEDIFTLGQRHFLTLAQRLEWRWINVGQTSWCYLGISVESLIKWSCDRTCDRSEDVRDQIITFGAYP